MAEKFDIEIEEEEVGQTETTWQSLVRRVVLAGAGAVGLAQDEAEAFVRRLVLRGELGEKDGRSLLAEIHEQQRRFARLGPLFLLERQVEFVLHRLSVPTKTEIDQLSVKIEALSQKVDHLRQLLQQKEGRQRGDD